MNPLLNETEQAVVAAARSAANDLVAPLADSIDADAMCPTELLHLLGDAGLLAVDGECGLLGLALTTEELARASATVATLTAAHCAAGLALRDQDVDLDVSGRQMVAVAIGTGGAIEVTEQAAGSWQLDGEIGMVAGAAYAGRFLVVADAGSGAALFVVEAANPALTVDAEVPMLGLRGSGTATLHFRGVVIAAADRIGGPRDAETAIGYLHVLQAARAVGVAQSALDRALADVVRRREEGDRVDRSQSIQWMLADIATETEAVRVSTWYAATREPGDALDEAAAGCRVLAAEAAAQGARRAVQVFGARGALRSEGVERIFRDAKLMEIEGGTNEEQLRRVAAHLLPDIAQA